MAFILSAGFILVLLVIFLFVELSADLVPSSKPVKKTNSGTKYITSFSFKSILPLLSVLLNFSTSIKGWFSSFIFILY